MPTPEKESQVEEIRSRLSRCTIAIATGYQGVSASDMTNLRARLREQGIEYRVIKNTLTIRAANALGKEGVGNVLIGPTALAFGYGDATAAAKGVHRRTLRLPGRHWLFTGRLWMGVILSAGQVVELASLPPREELLARLLGQMQAPITGLVTALSGPIRGPCHRPATRI